MRIAAVVLGLVLAGQTLWAAEPAKEDFAAGYELALRKDSGLHHLPLPEKVYQQVVRSDLADIRVFNGQGQVVPHMLRFERKMAAPEVRRQELPFSPFSNMVPTGALVSQSDTRVFRGAGGTGKGGESRASARPPGWKTKKSGRGTAT